MTDAAGPVDGRALLERLKPTLREESVQIILSPVVLDEWEAKQQALVDAAEEDQKASRLAAGKPSKKTTDLQRELTEFEAGPLAEAAVWFRFRAMSKDGYRDLCAAHPPKKEDRYDAMLGYDRDAVDDAMVKACLFDPTFTDCTKKGCQHTDCGSWQQFEQTVNAGEWEELRKTCQAANRAVTDLPKSLLPSVIQRLSGGGSGSRTRRG